jgi:hypothetical protein
MLPEVLCQHLVSHWPAKACGGGTINVNFLVIGKPFVNFNQRIDKDGRTAYTSIFL